MKTLRLSVTWTCMFIMMFAANAGWAEEATYTTIAVDEKSGYARSGWPVHVGVPVYGIEQAPVDELWLARVGSDGDLTPVPFQVVQVISPDDAIEMQRRQAIKTVDLVFLADLQANESARFRLYFGEAAAGREAAQHSAELTVETGEHLERSVDTGVVRFGFHELSGQLLNYQLADSELVHFTIPARKRPIHHNPDVWALPEAWTHASGWDVTNEDRAPQYEQASGPLMWRSVRTGALPRSDIETSVVYTVYAGLPFMLESSSMRFTSNQIVNGVRNNELVFSRGLQTHGVYIGHDWQAHTMRMFNPDDPEENFRHVRDDILPPDIPFIGLYHESRRDGLGMVTLDRFAYNPALSSGGMGGAHYYFNDGQIHRDVRRNFLYFCRAEVFNRAWGDNWNSVVIPAGAQFAENSAVLAFPVDKAEDGAACFEKAEHWTRLLRNPPRVWILDGIDWRRRAR